MSALETKAFRAFPNGDEPRDVVPSTAVGIGALIAGLNVVRHDVERSIIDAAVVMRLLLANAEPEGHDEYAHFLAQSWLDRFGAYVPDPS